MTVAEPLTIISGGPDAGDHVRHPSGRQKRNHHGRAAGSDNGRSLDDFFLIAKQRQYRTALDLFLHIPGDRARSSLVSHLVIASPSSHCSGALLQAKDPDLLRQMWSRPDSCRKRNGVFS